MLLILLLGILSAFFIFYYHKRKQRFIYWKQRGFPTLDTAPHWFFGDFQKSLLGKKGFMVAYGEAHNEFKRRGHKVGGMYMLQVPIVIVTDSELMKRMLQTDFDSFADRGVSVDPVNNPLGMHLFSLDGEPWRRIRRKLSPTFTSGKIKMMFPIMEKHVDILIEVTKNLCKSEQDVDYHEWLDKTGIDVITHVAFGLDCNTLESKNDTLFEMTRRIIHPKLWQILKLILLDFKSPADIALLLSCDKEMSDFFIKLVKDIVDHRRQNKIQARDFMQLLIEMIEEEEKDAGSGLTMLEVAAQAFSFFAAGFETSSRTVLFALYAIAQHQNVQDLLRQSIKKDMEDAKGAYEYDWIMNNEWLDMVIKETLRLYPPGIGPIRQATRDYNIQELNLTIPDKTSIVFSSYGFHHDPESFQNPLEFKPDRFSKENATNIQPFTYIPFGEGPRVCVGKRFGYLLSKLMLAKIIMNFEILQSHLTEYPFKVNPITTSILLEPEKPIYFKFKPL